MHALKNHPKNPEGIEPGDKVTYLGGHWTAAGVTWRGVKVNIGDIFTVNNILESGGQLFVYVDELNHFANDQIHNFKLCQKLNKVLTGSKARLFVGGKEIPIVGDVGFRVDIDPHDHQWAEYVGLFQRFRYCTVCDKKEPS